MSVDSRAKEFRRSCTIRIKNDGGATIKLVDWNIEWGRLEPEGPPPDTIPAHDTLTLFAVATPGPWMTGTEGWIVYEVQDEDGDGVTGETVRFKVGWDVPYMGHNDYIGDAPAKIEAREPYDDKADHGWVTIVAPESPKGKTDSPPDEDAYRNVDAATEKKTGVADPPNAPLPMVICQDMKGDGATGNPNLYFKLGHGWAEKWKEADKTKRDFLPVPSDAAASDTMNEAGIKAIATKMLKAFTTVCGKAKGGTVYTALSHGGIHLWADDKDKENKEKELKRRQDQLTKDREALKTYKNGLDKSQTTYKESMAYVEVEQARINMENALVNRKLFPTFSLGSQKGEINEHYLVMDFNYFVYLDHPNGGWDDKDKKAFEARKTFFTDLRAVFKTNNIKTLHILACNIGQDSIFIGRVGKELGVGIVAHPEYVQIQTPSGFVGLSTDKDGKNMTVKFTTVEVPTLGIVTG